MGKLLCEDLLRKQRVSVYRTSQSDNRNENEKTTSLTWRQLTFSCQQPYSVYPQAKTQVPLNRVSAAQKQAKTVFCRKSGVIPPMMTISLSQKWLSTAGVTVIAMYR